MLSKHEKKKKERQKERDIAEEFEELEVGASLSASVLAGQENFTFVSFLSILTNTTALTHMPPPHTHTH